MASTSRVPVACGVDVGSSNLKVVTIDAEGSVRARVTRPTPRFAADPSIDVGGMLAAIEDMMVQACGDRAVIHAVCVAGVGEDGVLVDAAQRPLTTPLAWFDPRRRRLFETMRPDLDDIDAFDAATDATRTIVGWRWARSEYTGQEATSWVAVTDLPSVRWSGRSFLSDTLAARTAAWRSDTRSWSRPRVQSTLGTMDLLPPVVSTGSVVGALDAPALRDRGAVAADAITAAGGHDHPIAGWGVAQMVPGAILDSMGTAEVVVAQRPELLADRFGNVEVAPGIRSTGTTLLHVEELARNVQWASRDPAVADRIRALLDGSEQPVDLESQEFAPGHRGGGLPRFVRGASADPRVRASAVLCALARAGRDAVRAVAGPDVVAPEVRFAGGWVRSPGWMEIKARINGFHASPVLEPEVTAVGAALLAATARGWSPDPGRALGGFTTRILS